MLFNIEREDYRKGFDSLIKFYVGDKSRKKEALEKLYLVANNSKEWVKKDGFRDVDRGFKEMLRCIAINKINININTLNISSPIYFKL